MRLGGTLRECAGAVFLLTALALLSGTFSQLPKIVVDNYTAATATSTSRGLDNFAREAYDFEPYGTTTITGSGVTLPPLFLPDLQSAGGLLCAPLLALVLVSAPARRQVSSSVVEALALPARVASRCVSAALKAVLRTGPIPKHVAFIMDGNRRWAKQQGLRTLAGHNTGYQALVDVLTHCKDLGVEIVTVYAFSIENFKRSQAEVDYLMTLAMSKFEEAVSKQGQLYKHQVRVQVLGDLSLLSPAVQASCARVAAATRECRGPLLNVWCVPLAPPPPPPQTVRALFPKRAGRGRRLTDGRCGVLCVALAAASLTPPAKSWKRPPRRLARG